MIAFLKKNKVYLWIFFIICLAAYLRFYRLGQVYVFNFDEEYQATYAWTLVKHFHRIWIGVSSSFLDFYLGPYFTYFTSFLLRISKGDPMLTAYFASFLGVVTTVVFFFTGWKIFNLTTGIVSSLLYATLPLFVFFDQKYWNTMFTPLITLLLFLTLNLVKKSAWFWVLFAGLFGVILETHLEPTPLLLIGFWYFVKGAYYKKTKIILVSLLVFALLYWPLAMFDYYHNFSNLTIFSRFGQGVSESKVTFNPVSKFKTLFDTIGRYWYLKAGNPNADEINFGCTSLSVKPELSFIDKYARRTYAAPFLSLITVALLLYFLKISFGKLPEQYKLLRIFLIVSVISFSLFPGGSSEYYALFFLVLFTFIPGILISKVVGNIRKVIFILLIVAVSVLGINTVLGTSDEFSLGPKKILIGKVMDVLG
ncbi:MAG: glycosyltransferase family 39 protein, partial [Candidatus Daviesbacteria bacterium]|nr:glycosyltransferase family 39 protein [Candidatus Daviesbacteria bacterium]